MNLRTIYVVFFFVAILVFQAIDTRRINDLERELADLKARVARLESASIKVLTSDGEEQVFVVDLGKDGQYVARRLAQPTSKP